MQDPGQGFDEFGHAYFKEEITWQPQNAMTTTPLNDVYCVRSQMPGGGFSTTDLTLYCFAVGDGGLIRFTSNGGLSPWRTLFSGVRENLRKVVILGVVPESVGFGDFGGSAASAARGAWPFRSTHSNAT